MKTLTKEQRIEIYACALEMAKTVDYRSLGMCHFIKNATILLLEMKQYPYVSVYKSGDLPINYPEFYSFKPKNLGLMGDYWFPLDEEHWNVRLKILEQLAKGKSYEQVN